MIVIDSDVPTCLVGVAHPNNDRARTLLKDCIRRGERLVADAEVLQEIRHR